MRHLARHLVLAVCLAFLGSVSHAAPAPHETANEKKATHRTKVAPPVDDEAEEEAIVRRRAQRSSRTKAARAARASEEVESDSSDDEEADDDEDEDEEEAADRRRADRTRRKKAARAARAREEAERDSSDDEAAVDDEEEAADRRRADRTRRKKAARAARAREEAENDSDRIAFASEDEGETIDSHDEVDDDSADFLATRTKLRKNGAARAKDWNFAIGPYVWASAVDATVSLGSASVAAGVDFIDVTRHTRYGVELLAEGRYGRFSITGDLMYGVVDVNGVREVGPFMVALDGTASSLQLEGTGGYRLFGDNHSLLSVEARAGVRYQRTAISGSVSVAGSVFTPPAQIDAGSDALAGGRVFLRPLKRFELSSSFDVGVFGASTSTWSAAADASVRITRRVLLSLGWRTLTMARANVEIVMHGPRAAVQLLF